MGCALDPAAVADMQRVYDRVIKEVFGDQKLDEHLQERIAAEIFTAANTCRDDWEQRAIQAGHRVRDTVDGQAPHTAKIYDLVYTWSMVKERCSADELSRNWAAAPNEK